MNALFVLRPAKLRAFNFGHPCPPSKKDEVLLLGQAEPTMVGIEINRSTIFKTSKHSQSQSLLFPHQPFPKPHYPLLHTTLASLVKGRWIDGKAQTLLCCFLLAICPPFLYSKLFCRQDGGIALHPPTLSKTALSLENRQHPCLFMNALLALRPCLVSH